MLQKTHKAAKLLVDDYQVFMSFRGPDTRNDFADVLYDHLDRVGIHVFRDNDEISIGQPINAILQGIENSEICVPIFSRTFASSTWCLCEVEKMVELDKEIVPIFYEVSPDDVKLKTKLYKFPMMKHQWKHGKEKVKKWKDSLRKVAQIKGVEMGQDMSYIEFCKKFADEISSKLKPRRSLETDILVGIDTETESAMELLSEEPIGVRYVLVHGMGGIGKTTLAKVVFDEVVGNFDCSCFLENIREISLRCNGVQDLKKQLQENLDPRLAGQVSGGIKERFRRKKVLLVLDDVDKWEQIQQLAGKSNWFGPGSRIIVTTRNMDVMKQYPDQSEVYPFEVTALEPDQALELFSRHAFREDTPPIAFHSLSRKIVDETGRLPLTLKVIGSLLYNKKNEQVWKDVVVRLRRIPVKEVKERLKISYNMLEHDQRQIFLDIACFFAGKKKEKAVYMWKTRDWYPHWGLEVLSSMSLIKIENGNKIWMHDQLKDLGRDIVREEGIESPWQRSRLWDEEALAVLKSREGKVNVEALSTLCDDHSLLTTWTDEHFVSFKKLRFLELSGAQIEGNFHNLLPELRWLSWHLCSTNFNVANLCLKNLVVLELWFSPEVKTWDGWSLIQTLRNLEVLELSNCSFVTTTSDFSDNSRLERLTLRGCKGLLEIHGSIGRLTKLKCLDLTVSLSFRGLPEEIGLLESLEELKVSGNDYGSVEDLFKFPDSIGKLKSLLVLKLQNFYMADIPKSIGGLRKLGCLSLRHCRGIEVIPESLGDLESLTELDLSYTCIRTLPESIGRLGQLMTLDLDYCTQLEVLPESLGDLKSLVKLTSAESKISFLPNSIGGLQELKLLNVRGTHIRKLPLSIGGMGKLDKISAFATPLEELPVEIGELCNLRHLNLNITHISSLPSTISQLTRLEVLRLYSTDQLQELPELPSSLKTLKVSSRSLEIFPDITKLNNLIDLELVGSNNCQWPRDLRNSQLFDGFKRLTSLGILLSNSTTPLPFTLGSLTQLKRLSLYLPTDVDCSTPMDKELSGMVLPDLSNLKNLINVQFSNFRSKDEFESLHFGELEMVKFVKITNCISKVIELCLFKNLELLVLKSCKSLNILPDLSHLKNFRCLFLTDCSELVDVSGLGEIESLVKLVIIRCHSLERVEILSKSRGLFHIDLYDCPKLRSIQVADSLRLSELHIHGCDSLENVDALKRISVSGMINKMPFENFDQRS